VDRDGLIHEPEKHITETSEGKQETKYLLVSAAERPFQPQQAMLLDLASTGLSTVVLI